MFRLFVLFHLLLTSLFACQDSYHACLQKAKDTNAIRKNSLSIPLVNNKRLIYSLASPKQKVLKHDPFLGLYLVEHKTKAPYYFAIGMPLQLGLGVVDKQRAQEGKILKNQIGLNTLARINQKYEGPALLTNSCCTLEGIAGKEGVIQKEYIEHFLAKSPLEYGDIGVRVHNQNGFVVVNASDPYSEKNPFKKGDCIVSFDGKKINAASVLMKKILFAKLGSRHKVQVKRGSKIFDFDVLTRKRYGGGNISDTFLESKGIYFDKDMKIVKLSAAFKEYGLLLGDRLMQVNGVSVKTQAELRRYIEDFKDYSALLFERRNFQFFVNIK